MECIDWGAERDKFETWAAEKLSLDIGTTGTGYYWRATRMAWEAWKASKQSTYQENVSKNSGEIDK